MRFSYQDRNEIKERLATHRYDVLVIGGGVTGAGIALDAVSRGLKTALIEKDDFASGTSSRSTKLIHGGLRYLKQFEFALVKEVGSERAVVHSLAPHLVVPEKMLLPLREKRGYGSLLTSLGLMLYDWLAGVIPKDRRRMLTRLQTLRREPLLKKDQVKGGALYAEYRTDDARLTIEIIKKAASMGADILNYCELSELLNNNNKLTGARVQDNISDSVFVIKSIAIINAAGPWVDQIRVMDKSREGKRLHLTKGVHIVFPRKKFPVRQSIYFDIEDERMIFAIPRGRTTYVGTTDTTYTDKIEDVHTNRDDVVYLLKGINENFPSLNLKVEDVESSWAGLRPLIHEDGKSTTELSRKDEIFESGSGLISIAGGKLTGYRKMAERVVDMVIKSYFGDRKLPSSKTNKLKLADGKFATYRKVQLYINGLRRKLKTLGLDDDYAQYLVGLYGAKSDEVLAAMNNIHDADPALRLLKCELAYTMTHEMVCSSVDFFNRRTGRIYFDIGAVIKYKEEILAMMAQKLNWSEAQRIRDREILEREIGKATGFR